MVKKRKSVKGLSNNKSKMTYATIYKGKSKDKSSLHKEILGIIIIVIGLLTSISVISYSSGDFQYVQDISWSDLIPSQDNAKSQVKNSLGIIGAMISYYMVYSTFGYPSIIISMLLILVGWVIFRKIPFKKTIYLHTIALWFMLLSVISFGWLHVNMGYVNSNWSGTVGYSITDLGNKILGPGYILVISVLWMITIWTIFRKNLIKIFEYVNSVLKNKFKEKSSKKMKKRPTLSQHDTISSEKGLKENDKTINRNTNDIGDVSTKKTLKNKTKINNAKISSSIHTNSKYTFPTLSLLTEPIHQKVVIDKEEIETNKSIIIEKLQQHRVKILDINAVVGPTVTLYELVPAPDVKISKIQSYSNDLKMAMAAYGLRIIAPIPGKAAVGIEVPNRNKQTVHIHSILSSQDFIQSTGILPIGFGKTIQNEVFILDLSKLPHLLIAGATGSGKSVGINTILTSLLYKKHPDELKFVLIDPKKIELSLYRNIMNHYLAALPNQEEPIITDVSYVLETLLSVCREMDNRYDLLKKAHVRDIEDYNMKFLKNKLLEVENHRFLPYIVIVIDELADLMIVAGKKIEEPIARIAQLARAVGIHLIVATQRPSVNVITGTIKANFPARIAYQVASKIDSRTILDVGGAEQLVGQGDMLFSKGSGIIRLQNAYVSTEEVENISSFIGEQEGFEKPYLLPEDPKEQNGMDGFNEPLDDLFVPAAKTIVLYQQGSVSFLQRKLKIGYNRAGRIMDQLHQANIVGPAHGSSAREIHVKTEEDLMDILRAYDIKK